MAKKENLALRLRRIIYYRGLLHKLERRYRREVRAYHKQYFPIRWLRVSDIVRDDITAYLAHEGKDKHELIDLAKKLYESSKDIQHQIAIYNPFSLALLAYVMFYILDLKFPIAFSGVDIDYNPTTLAMAMALGAFLGYKVSSLFMHLQNVKSAIASVLSSLDSQLGEALKSAFLYADNGQIPTAQSNPTLHVTIVVSRSIQIVAGFALLGILFAWLGIWYFFIKAGILIYSTPSSNYQINLALLTITLLLSLGSTLNLILAIAPLRYKDWSTNSKFEILDQLAPSKSVQFRNQVYDQSTRTAIAIEQARRRLSAL
jgi:hypothetical protein